MRFAGKRAVFLNAEGTEAACNQPKSGIAVLKHQLTAIGTIDNWLPERSIVGALAILNPIR